MSAEKLQKKAAKVGFDWDSVAPVWDKVAEELQELREAVAEKDSGHINEELGDVLFSLVNLARFLKVDPELALMHTNCKFMHRFSHGPSSSYRQSSYRAPANDFRRQNRYNNNNAASFEDKLSKFLKDSDERLTDLRKKTDSKRGGRGGSRRSE